MAHMNLSTEETNSWTADVWLPKGREWDGLGVWGYQMQTITLRMDKQRGPAVQHTEWYSVSWDRLRWKII